MSIEKGKEVIRIEAEAIARLEGRIGEAFNRAVDLLAGCKGRVIVSGMGKSGVIARKLAATLSSTGTPALFLHPAEGLHGDLGMVTKEDAVIIISKSGHTEELSPLLQVFHLIDIPIIAIVGDVRSNLAQASDVVLDASVSREACPYDLAPTASTAVAMALGDALAVALLEKKNFSKEDFAFIHPGGALGRKLHLKVGDLMHTGDEVPKISKNAPIKNVIYEMTSKRLGVTCVLDEEGKLSGIITDGDLRRLLEKTLDLTYVTASDIATWNPRTIGPAEMATRAINIMEQYNITQLVVVEGDRKPVGIIHMHDLLKAGIA